MTSFSNYESFEKQQLMAMREAENRALDCIDCPKCGSQWFEEVSFARYQADHHVVVGQDVPPQPGISPFKMLRCVRCANLLEPRIVHQTRDLGAKGYDSFLDTLEGVGDTRKTAEDKKKEAAGEIPAEKL
jgi:hypothetical protein